MRRSHSGARDHHPAAHRVSLGGSLGLRCWEASHSSREGSFVWPGLLWKHGTHSEHQNPSGGPESGMCWTEDSVPNTHPGRGFPTGFLGDISHMLAQSQVTCQQGPSVTSLRQDEKDTLALWTLPREALCSVGFAMSPLAVISHSCECDRILSPGSFQDQ